MKVLQDIKTSSIILLFGNGVEKKTKEGHYVFISEYNAPADFECIWESKLKTNMNARYETNPTEKLFKYILP